MVSVLNGLCYAELVLTFPSTGSDYNFLQKGYGNLLACLYLWASMLLKEAGGRGIGAFTFATYICQVFYPGCRPPGMGMPKQFC